MEAIDVELYVDLPRSVEDLLAKICADKRWPPVDADVRRRLAARGEQGSLEILRRIEPPTVTITSTLNGYIIRLLERLRSPASTPEKVRCLSGLQSPAQSPKFRTVRLYSDGTASEAVAETVAEAEAGLVPCSLVREVPREIGQAELEALGEMEFRKQFLILNYLGRNELHKVTTVGELKLLKDLPMIEFEARVWEQLGVRFVKREDRRMYNDWDSGKTHVYDCYVSSEGIYTFKGPFLSKSKTHLQKVLGDDNVLRVKFAEEATENLGIGSNDHFFSGYREIAIKKGILVGLRKYYFFVFKDGGTKDKRKNPASSPVKCFFIRLHSDASVDKNDPKPYKLADCATASEARPRFMHGHTLSSVEKYMARFSLILSKTYTVKVDMTEVKMEIVEDIYCTDKKSGKPIYRDGKPLIHTDGTGYISEDLALLCPKNIHEGICNNDKDIEFIRNLDDHENGDAEAEQLGVEMQEPPMLMQCRLFNKGYAVKGTLLVNKTLGRRTIRVHDSMVKVVPDSYPSIALSENSLEIVGTSNRPKRTNLSRNLIALLSHGGVPNKFFLDLLDESLRESNGAFSNENAALKVAMNKPDKDSTIARMILCGIPLAEPYLKSRLTRLLKDQKTSLKEGKIYVPESYYLMGTADPTGKLESDEVCIVLENGHVSGKVLVYRNPGVHFGDVHVMTARYIKELEPVVGNAKFAIFFSTKGSRNVADEIGGGDFDGDMYWVSRNPTLLQHFKASEPWTPSPSTRKAKAESKKPRELLGEELEDELFKLFLRTRFMPSYAIGEAADGCLALMDRYLTLQDDCTDEKNRVKENINKLIDIYYEALDAPKNGWKVEVPKVLKPRSFPHYMEKKNSFISKSILGEIYDRVTEYQAEDNLSKDVWKLPHFEVVLNHECQSKWKSYYKDYREEMSNAMDIQDRDLKIDAAEQVKRKYKRLLYGAEDLEDSTRNIVDIYNEALAIYHECYDYAITQRSPSLCGFAWNVAGSALCKFLISKQVDERAFLCLPSALRQVL